MTTRFSHKIFAIFMTFLMFSSSIGFSMDVHFCGNEMENFSFFGDAEECEMMQPKQENESNRSCCEAPKKEIKSCHEELSKEDCCHNERFTLNNSGEFENSEFSLEQFQQALTTVIILVPNFTLFSISAEKVNYAHYNPPPLIEDISILYQVFRI